MSKIMIVTIKTVVVADSKKQALKLAMDELKAKVADPNHVPHALIMDQKVSFSEGEFF